MLPWGAIGRRSCRDKGQEPVFAAPHSSSAKEDRITVTTDWQVTEPPCDRAPPQQLMGDEPDRAVWRSSRALERCNTPSPWPSSMCEWLEERLDTTRANLAGEIWLLAVAILFWSSKCS